MDCSKTEVFLKEWERMCFSYGCWYRDCTLNKVCDGCDEACRTFVQKNPEEAIKIVQEWSDAHPIKTRLSVLKEAFPNAKYESAGVPEACAGDLFGFKKCREEERTNSGCYKCWNTPIEDGE